MGRRGERKGRERDDGREEAGGRRILRQETW
jgi:hypothetical protein